jgi:hypothetical protein
MSEVGNPVNSPVELSKRPEKNSRAVLVGSAATALSRMFGFDPAEVPTYEATSAIVRPQPPFKSEAIAFD